MVDIRLYTRIIIRRGPDYLVGKILGGPELRWSDSPWDAWYTRDLEAAALVAQAIGGDMWLLTRWQRR